MNKTKTAPPTPMIAKYLMPLLNLVSKPKYIYETQNIIIAPINNDKNGAPENRLISKIGIQ
jgi:hypothetical protein